VKILILNPPFKTSCGRYSRASRSPAIAKGGTFYYPIWLAYVTGVLEQAGHNVKLIDAPARRMTVADVVSLARDWKPELAVLDVTTPSVYHDVELAAALKDEVPGAFVVLVGTHVTALPEETLELDEKVDAVAIREYDYTLRELAATLEIGGDIQSVAGLCCRSAQGELTRTPQRSLIRDLDSLPFVTQVYERHLNIEDYFYTNARHPVVTIISGRGCPHQCVYCVLPQVMNGRGYRRRSVKNVVDELEYIATNQPQVNDIFFEDDTLTANPKRTRKICDEIIRRGLKLTWTCNSRADVDLETLKSMKAAGCRLMCVGYESGDQRVLDAMKKDLTVDKIRQFARDAKKVGILVHGCFLVGNPGETCESLKTTLNLAMELDPDTAQFYPIMIYPGTEAYTWAQENDYLTTYDFSEWLTEDGLHSTIVSRPGLSNRELVEFCDYARQQFYLRPRYVLSKMWEVLTHPREGKRFLKSFRTFARYLVRGTFGSRSPFSRASQLPQ
jgi:anaerobic magnesium-protoporphyrin IX monomethyl ester cyclase